MRSSYQAWYKGMNLSTFLKNSPPPSNHSPNPRGKTPQPPTMPRPELTPRLVGVQVVSNETFTELAYIISNLTGAELIGERLGPVGCLPLDCGN